MGLATHFAVPVTYVRIAFAVLSILGGAGLPLYLAAWVLIPKRVPMWPSPRVSSATLAVPPRERRPCGSQPVPVIRSPVLLQRERNVMSQNHVVAGGTPADKRRRARVVLWAAGVVALLGLWAAASPPHT